MGTVQHAGRFEWAPAALVVQAGKYPKIVKLLNPSRVYPSTDGER